MLNLRHILFIYIFFMEKIQSSEIITVTHLNVNMWITWVRDDFKKAIYWTLAFFAEKSVNNLVSNSDISKIVTPVLDMWGDVLGFSEVYGTKQLNELIDLLEKRWYKVFYSDAFEMWSQFEEKEHLYNVIGIKHQSLSNVTINKTQVVQPRKLPWVIFSILHLLRGNEEKSQSFCEKVSDAKRIYNRLASGILDWVIKDFKVWDEFVLSHLHVHADNPNLSNFFENHTYSDIPHLMYWDFNIWNLDEFLLKPPFNWIWYKKLLSNESKTYSYAKWMDNIPVFKTPDNVIGNPLMRHISTETFSSLSDHNGLITRFKI